MNILRFVLATGLTLPLFGAAIADPAAADHRWRLRFIEPHYRSYYPGPMYVPRPFYDRGFYDDLEYDEDFEEDYYEPRYAEPDEYDFDEPPPKPAKKKKKTVNSERPSDGQTTKTASKQPESKSEQAKKRTASTGSDKAVNCDRAAKIVSSYGFGAVTAKSCTGKIYSFNASRGGKSYEIKLSSASGELTEVRKVQ
jgi:hypothetical protein